LIQEKFQQGPTSVLVVFTDGSLDATGAEFQAAEKQALDQLAAAKIPHLETIQTYANTDSTLLLSKDGHSSVAVLNFDAPLEIIQKQIDQIRRLSRGAACRSTSRASRP